MQAYRLGIFSPRKHFPDATEEVPVRHFQHTGQHAPPFMPPEMIMLRIGAPAEEAICIRKFGLS